MPRPSEIVPGLARIKSATVGMIGDCTAMILCEIFIPGKSSLRHALKANWIHHYHLLCQHSVAVFNREVHRSSRCARLLLRCASPALRGDRFERLAVQGVIDPA